MVQVVATSEKFWQSESRQRLGHFWLNLTDCLEVKGLEVKLYKRMPPVKFIAWLWEARILPMGAS
eukprot:7636216-Lingulodinium_polyedra.AAC.1